MISINAIHAEITWNLSDDGTLTISGTNMPDYTYGNSAPWLWSYSQIKKVVIKNGVTNIVNQAFTGMCNFTSIEIPNSVTSIGYAAFDCCSSLTTIDIPSSVTNIGNYALSGCSSLTSINLPNTITSIPNSLFEGCTDLKTISIPNSVTNIGDNAFRTCLSLTSITIPQTVTNIGNSAFYDCTNLVSAYIPNSVTSIGEEAFTGCCMLKSIEIPNSITSIERGVFCGCSSLASVNIPNSVTHIGYEAFRYCSNLKSIIIPNSVTYIESYAFEGCSSATSISIPNSVKTIEGYAFFDCSKLVSLAIPNSVESIGEGSFGGCSSLVSVTIPNSVTSIGQYAFKDCASLSSISVEENNIRYDSRENCNAIIETESNILIQGCKNTVIPNTVTSIGDHAFWGCSGLTSIEIPNSAKSIGDDAFYGCSSLTEINIPNSVTYIGYCAFMDCSSLTSISLPNSITTINSSVFYNCSSLLSINIPYSVTFIGECAFWGCSSLTSIKCEAVSPPKCQYNDAIFNEVNESIPVYVPANSIDLYKTADGWKIFTNLQTFSTISISDDEYCQFTGQDIIYTRPFNNTVWQALYIPFSLSYSDWKDNFEVAYINGIRQLDTDDDGIIDNTIMDIVKIKDGSLIPNTPYLIKAKTTGTKTITLKNATIYKEEEKSIDCSTTIAKYIFTGTYHTIPAATLIENNYYAMGGGSLIMTDGTSSLKPFRWYFKVEPRSPMYNISESAKSITINVVGEESETTGIDEQRIVNDKSLIYDLNGRVVNENTIKPGIYIKNGKKIVIK